MELRERIQSSSLSRVLYTTAPVHVQLEPNLCRSKKKPICTYIYAYVCVNHCNIHLTSVIVLDSQETTLTKHDGHKTRIQIRRASHLEIAGLMLHFPALSAKFADRAGKCISACVCFLKQFGTFVDVGSLMNVSLCKFCYLSSILVCKVRLRDTFVPCGNSSW